MTKDNIKTIFIPTFLQILWCLLVSVVIMVASYWDVLLRTVTQSSGTSLASITSSFTSSLSHVGSLPLAGSAFIIVFWGVLAIVVYIVGLVLVNVLIDVRNSVVINTTFTKPDGTRNGGTRLLTKLGAGLALVLLLVVCGLVVFPLCIQLMGVALGSGFAVSALVLGAGAIGGLAAVLYLLWSFVQIVFVLL